MGILAPVIARYEAIANFTGKPYMALCKSGIASYLAMTVEMM